VAVTVKHQFVSAIPDGPDDTVVRPSDWNDDHELIGLGTMAEQDADNVTITGGTINGISTATIAADVTSNNVAKILLMGL